MKKNQNQTNKLSSPRHFFRVSRREVAPPGSDCATGGWGGGGGGGGGAQRAPAGRRGKRFPDGRWIPGGPEGPGAAERGNFGAKTAPRWPLRVSMPRYCGTRGIPESARARRTRRHLTMRERSCTAEGRTRPRGPAAAPGSAAIAPKPPAHTGRSHPGRLRRKGSGSDSGLR